MVGLVMYYCRKGQSVSHERMLVWPSQCDCSYWHDKSWQFQNIYYHLGHIYCCAKEACSKSLRFCQVAECLAIKECIGGGIDIREHVVISRGCLPLLCPQRCASEISTESKDHGSLNHHWLVEMCRR